MSQINEITFLPRDLENLEKLSKYADLMAKDVGRISDDFANKGSLGLWWDRKVPDEDKWLFYFFTLFKSSNREDVLCEVKKYQTFFKELSDAVCKIKDPEKMSDAEREDPQNKIIDKLHKKLSEFQEAAEAGKCNTSSSTLYKLHRSFINQREEIKNLITGAESVVLRKAYQDVVTKWEKANERIIELEKKLNGSIDRHDEILRRFEQIMGSYEGLLEGQKNLLNENEELQKKITNLQKKNQEIRRYESKQLEENQELKEKIENLQKKNQEIERNESKQLEDNQKLRREIDNLWKAFSELRRN